MGAKRITVGILDYGVGNISSLSRVLIKLGCKIKVVKNERDFADIKTLVLPGVGAAKYAMRELTRNELDQSIKREYFENGLKLIGICLGMQILFENSAEGNTKCLGIFSGNIQELPNKKCHVGWNIVDSTKGNGKYKKEAYYFNHSYYAKTDGAFISAVTHENLEIPAIVEKELVIGFQFHPEKSQRSGERLLKNSIFGREI